MKSNHSVPGDVSAAFADASKALALSEHSQLNLVVGLSQHSQLEVGTPSRHLALTGISV